VKRPKKTIAVSGPPDETGGQSARSGRKWIFRLTAMFGVTVVFFAVLEVGLRILGYGFPVQFFVPSPAGQPGVLVDNPQFSRRYFSEALKRIPQSMAFAEVKAPQELRVFVFGESAAEGDPDPSFGFARVLRVLLEDRYPDRRVKVINTAVTAINSHVIRPIALECANFGGDVWVVYMGNNEVVGPFGSGTVFGPQAPSLALIRANIAVKSTRIGQVMDALLQGSARRGSPKEWGGMEMFLDQQVALSDPRTASVYQYFRRNLDDMVEAGVRSGAKVILSTVGSNLRDCPPFASLHRRDLPVGDSDRWNQKFKAGVAFEDAGTAAEALVKYGEALAIDDQFAELHFRMGRCLAALGRPEDALGHYVLARDLDALRFRCDSGLNGIIRETAAGTGVRLADSETAFRNETTDGVPGREWFHEHVHLTQSGNYLVAVELAKQIVQCVEGDVRAGNLAADSFLPMQECGARLGLTDFDRGQMAREMAQRVSRPPFTHQLGHLADVARHDAEVAEMTARCRTNAAASIEIDRSAIARTPDDWRLHDNLAGILLQTGDPTGAAEQWREVIKLLPHRTTSYDLLGSVLLEKEKFDEAASVYQRVLEVDPGFFEGRLGLGRARMGQNRMAEAITLFRRAMVLKPDSARGQNHLGLALLQSGKAKEAGEAFREGLRLEPGFVSARLNLSAALLAEGRSTEALANYREAIQGSPDDAAPRLELAKALMKLGRGAEAVNQYRELARLHPFDFDARSALATALIRLQQFDEAASELVGALAIRPDSFEAHLNYGSILARQGRAEAATAQFEEAVRLRPDFLPARLNAAAAWIDQRRWDKAIPHLQEALKADPSNARARSLLQTALAGQKGG
jgi:tetratricopeptide (TPR) repeat protein